MFKFNSEKKLYVTAMTIAFVGLDLAGVSHGDKIALAAFFGALAPLYFPRFTAKLLKVRE